MGGQLLLEVDDVSLIDKEGLSPCGLLVNEGFLDKRVRQLGVGCLEVRGALALALQGVALTLLLQVVARLDAPLVLAC